MKEGYDVLLAQNGYEAIQTVTSQQVDLVLMDIQMPVMDGIASSREIRALQHETDHIPIIAMTAHASKNNEQ